MPRKRISKRTRDLIQSLVFFISTLGIISCLIIYLWVYTEIDETLLVIEIQNSTAKELQNEINEIPSLPKVIKILEHKSVIFWESTLTLSIRIPGEFFP